MEKKQVLTTSLGNTLEWFDFGLFIFMAPIIGAKFFPQHDGITNTLDALIVFAAGFICRPLGGILFGHLGDTRGRAQTLRLSVLLIAVSTLLVGLLPSYDSIGILAPILFTILRLAQGISIGGEYSGVMIYLAESAPQHQRGFITSFAATGANLGFLLATFSYLLLQGFLSQQEISNWGFRLPFIVAGIPGLIVLYYRFKLKETRVYSYIKSKHHLEAMPFLAVLTHAPRQLLKILGITCMSASFYYVFFGLMATYLEMYMGIPMKTTLYIQSGLLFCMLFLVPLAGYCGDILTRKRMLILTAICIIMFSVPGFFLLQTQSIVNILISLCIATIISSIDQGNSLTAVVENCPDNVRYSGIAFAYNLGNALFGGTAPIIVTLLTKHMGVMSPAIYLIFMACISLITITTLLDNNKSFGSIDTHQHKKYKK